MVAESLAYYRSGLSLLRHVEARKPTQRRFGAEADALWSQFQGELSLSDRIDLLLREADAQWPGAFGARTVFHLRGVAEDESFGSEWEGLDGQDAVALWRELEGQPTAVETPGAAYAAIAQAWGIVLTEVPAPEVTPDLQIVAAGPSALRALLERFLGDETLDWTAQVTVVATSPGHRQLAAATSALAGSTRSQRILSAGTPDEGGNIQGQDDLTAVTQSLKGKSTRLITSDDAAPADLELARRLSGDG